MKLEDTKVNQGGLMRCCLDTIFTLDPDKDWEDGTVVDCKHEPAGNKNIILQDDTWKWNRLPTLP